MERGTTSALALISTRPRVGVHWRAPRTAMRALLVCPGDADLLSLYGRVIWEASQDKDRVADYFEQAVQAAPGDCYVLGSYASFLWDAEDDEDEAPTRAADVVRSCDSPALVTAC